LVIPIHWDDFSRPLDEPVRPMPVRSWLKRVTVVRFQEVVKRIALSARVLVPERFRAYDLRDALS
jgi:hypothetical protein